MKARPVIGVTLPGSGRLAEPETVGALAIRAEQLGFGSVWLADHVLIPESTASRYPYSADGRIPWPLDEPWLDPLGVLAYLSAVTARVRLCTSVLVVPLRPSLPLARQCATIDTLSRGRLTLGVGAGWLKEEFDILGSEFATRGDRLTEAIRLMKACWTDDVVSIGAKRFRMDPKPPQGHALPVLAGGSSPSALRRAADVCDGWHPSMITPESWRLKRVELVSRLEANGRTIDSFRFTVRPGRSVALGSDLVGKYAAYGAQEIVADIEYRHLDNARDAMTALEALALDLRLD